MKGALNRDFKKGEVVYVVDYWGSDLGMQSFEAAAEILSVNKSDETFTAVLYGDTYQTYSFNDYGRLIFDSRTEAVAAAVQMPKPGDTVFHLIGERVYTRVVRGIEGYYSDGVYDLLVIPMHGRFIPAKEIGHTLFKNRADAIAAKK